MKINVNDLINSKIESGEITENQVIVIYDKNIDVVYLGKAKNAPLLLWDELKRESIANQINFWCTYCTWRHNSITYNVAHERVNVELSEYAAYNPYC